MQDWPRPGTGWKGWLGGRVCRWVAGGGKMNGWLGRQAGGGWVAE